MKDSDKKFSSEDIKRAKDHFDCRDYVKEKTTKYIKYGNKILACCLFHDDKHPSMKVGRTGFECYSCDAKGDAITLIASCDAGHFVSDITGDMFKDACEAIGVEVSIDIPITRDIEDNTNIFDVSIIFSSAQKNKAIADEYLLGRNIKSDAVNYGCLIPSETTSLHAQYPFLKNYRWLCFPMYRSIDGMVDKTIIGLNLRNIDTEDKTIKHRKIGQAGVYQPLKSNLEQEFIPIVQTIGCESGTDALSLRLPATAIFGVGNASKYDFMATAFDKDTAGIAASIDANKGMVLFDGSDIADSQEQCLLDVDLVSLELKLAAVLMFEQDTKVLDSVLWAAYLASYYSIEVAAAYTVFNGMYKRTMKNMLEILYMFYDHEFKGVDINQVEEEVKTLCFLLCNLRKIYESIDKTKIKKLIHAFSLIIPRRLTHRVTEQQWRAFDKNLYQPEPAIRVEDTKELRPFKIKSFAPYLRKSGLTTLAGSSFSGKTTLAIFMVASIIEENPNDKVVVYSLETNEALFRKKLAEYPFYDENRIKIIDKIHNIAYLQQLIKADADNGYSHFYIDNAKILYQEDYSVMDKAVRSLELIAATTGVSIVLLAQRMKSSKTDYFYIGRDEIHGGGSLFDRADAVITIQQFKPNPTPSELKAKTDLNDVHITFIKARAFEDNQDDRPIFDFKKLKDGTSRIDVIKR